MSAYDDYLNEVSELLRSKDLRERLDGVKQLAQLLKEPDLSMDSEALVFLLDSVVPAVNDRNFRVCQAALKALGTIVSMLGDAFKPYFNSVFPCIMDRLGDGKAPVREEALTGIEEVMRVVGPAPTFDKLFPALSDKSYRVREMTLTCFINTVEEFGPRAVSFRLVLPELCRLLEDPNPQVKENAMNAMEEIFRFTGNELKDELVRRKVRPQTMKELMERFSNVDIDTSRKLPMREITGGASGVSMSSRQMRGGSGGSSDRGRLKSMSMSNIHRNAAGEKAGPLSSMRKKKSISKSSSTSTSTTGSGSNNSSNGDARKKKDDYVNELIKSIKPVKARTKQDLEDEFNKLGPLLRDHKEDWHKRIDGLKRFMGLLVGGARDHSNFSTLLKHFRDPLTKQVQDLRSAVVKEATACVSLLAHVMGNSFELYADHFIPVLQKLTFVTIKIIAESGDQCIRNVLLSTRVTKVIPRIVEGTRARNQQLKIRSAEHILLILEECPPEHVEKQVNLLEKTIKDTLTDALSEVRATSRKAYWVFEKMYPSNARRIMENVDASVQKLLLEEGGSGAAPSLSGKKIRAAPRKGSGLKRTKSSLALSKTDSKGGPPSSSSSTKKKGGLRRSLSQQAIPQAPDVLSSEKERMAEPPRRVRRDRSMSAAHGAAPGGDTGSGGRRGRMRSNTVMGGGGDADSGSGGGSGSTRFGRSRGSREGGGSMRSKRRSGGGSGGGLGSGRGGGREHAAPKKEESLLDDIDNSELFSGSGDVDFGESLLGGGEEEQDLTAVLGKANSQFWSNRVECFQYLRRMYEAKNADIITYMEEVVKVHVSQLSDQHPKVLEVVADSLQDLLTFFPEDLVTFLSDIFPKVCALLADGKEERRELGFSILETAVSALTEEAVLSELLRLLDADSGESIVVVRGSLDYLSHIIPSTEDFFMDAANMKDLVGRLVSYATDKNTDLRKGALATLTSLYQLSSETFLEAFIGQPIASQLSVKKLLSTYVPDIDKELAEYTRARRSSRREGHRRIGSGAGSDNTPSPRSRRTSSSSNRASLGGGGGGGGGGGDMAPLISKVKGGGAGAKDALEELSTLSEQGDEAKWRPVMGQLLVAVLDATADADADTREAALVLLKNMLTHQSGLFADFTEVVFTKCLDAYKSDEKETQLAAEEALDAMASNLDQQKCMDVLSPHIVSEEDASLQVTIRLFSKVVQRFDASVLLDQLPQLLPGLIEAFRSPNADVRKAVVFALVDCYLIVGEEMTPFLSGLNSSQLKLVNIYIQRLSRGKK